MARWVTGATRPAGRYTAAGVVLVAPAPAMPAWSCVIALLRSRPTDVARMAVGLTLPLHANQLFGGLPRDTADRYLRRLGPESALAQYGLLAHIPPRAPRGGAPVLVLATPDDRLTPIGQTRATARRYDAHLREFPGMSHDLMLDVGWNRPLDAMLEWLGDRGL